MTGIEVVNRLDPSVQVIVCTAYSEHDLRNFELNALDYLTKPFSFDRFLTAIKKVDLHY